MTGLQKSETSRMFLWIRQSRATSQTLEMKLRTTVCIALVLIALLSAGVIDGLAYVFPMGTMGRTAAVLLVVTLSVGAGYWLARQITRPLTELTRAVDAFGSGELTRRCQVNSPHEIAELAHTLNRVAGSINKEIADRRLVEESLDRSRKQFRDLSAHLQTVREDERGRIARDIHDDLGQCLTTLKLNLALLVEDIPEDALMLRPKISEMSELVDGTIRSVRRIISELRPHLLDDLGLTAAIEWQSADFQKRTGMPVSLSIYPREILLDQERSTVVFRILQEALLNVARHAGATAVTVGLTEIDGEVELTIEDNGRGITREELENPKSFGLMGIRERAESQGGHVTITGKPKEGTSVAVRFSSTDEEPSL